ncbi:MAG: S1 family peptidase [Polyangiaceae bacterium]|nr:S1 family peptidase [Polyangiaceae bacterium]
MLPANVFGCRTFAALAGAWLLACAEHEVNPAAVSPSALLDGEPDSTHSFVVGLYTLEQGEPALCTGTLVAPGLVLTSRHCVAPRLDEGSAVECASSRFGPTLDPERIQVTTAEHMYPEQLAAPVAVARIWVHQTDDRVCGNDIALLGGSFAEDIEPVAPRLGEPARPAEGYAAVGYGSTGETFGDRRTVQQLRVGCVGAPCSQRIVDGEFFGAGALCHGDSGSPALDEQGRLFGVASRGDAACTESVYSEVAAHGDWLVSAAREARAELGHALPAWADDGASGAGGAPEAAAGSGGASGNGGGLGRPSELEAGAAPVEDHRIRGVRVGGGCALVDGRPSGPGRVAGSVLALLAAGVLVRSGLRSGTSRDKSR